MQSNGLQEQYASDVEVNLRIRVITALAFVKEDEVEDAFETLQDNITPEVVPILDYIEDVYIGRVRRGRRRTPTFHKSMWNMYARVHEELPRTNNAVEGWHRGFATNLGAYHPNFWRYLDMYTQERAMPVHGKVNPADLWSKPTSTQEAVQRCWYPPTHCCERL